jgi:hypothetical protein
MEPKPDIRFVRLDDAYDGGGMDPVSALGLWGLSLVGIGALVYAARSEAHRHRQLTYNDD